MTNADRTADRLATPGRIRVPRAAVAAAVLGISTLLSVAPVLGAGGNGSGNGNSSPPAGKGTSGNVKVHDALTGIESSGTDNEPHVCDFWLGFTFDAPFEAGTWVVVSWAPTGDGTTVASGVYDTAGDGVDSSSVIEVPAGHYRVEWAASGATSSKKKTFWVDADCDAPDSAAEEEPVADADEPPPSTDAPASPAEESQLDEEPVTDELVLAGQETPPSGDESQAGEETAPADEETAPADQDSPSGHDGTPPTDGTPVEDVVPPIDLPGDEEPAQAEDPGSGETGAPPVQEEPRADDSPDVPTMADTALPAPKAPIGLLATIGLLALVVLHASRRRDRRSDRDFGASA